MRTYLTRLTMTAAGVVLTGASLAAVAQADEADELVVVDPSVLEEMGNLEPCDEVSASDKMLLSIDPDAVPDHEAQPTEPKDIDPAKPWGELDLVPCYQIPVEPEDDDEEPDGPDGGEEPGDGGEEPESEGNGGGGNTDQATNDGGSNVQTDGVPSGNPDTSDGVDGEGFGDTADETAERKQQEIVTPTAAAGAGDNGSVMLAILAGVLGALGLFILVYGLRKRPRRGQQPA